MEVYLNTRSGTSDLTLFKTNFVIRVEKGIALQTAMLEAPMETYQEVAAEAGVVGLLAALS